MSNDQGRARRAELAAKIDALLNEYAGDLAPVNHDGWDYDPEWWDTGAPIVVDGWVTVIQFRNLDDSTTAAGRLYPPALGTATIRGLCHLGLTMNNS